MKLLRRGCSVLTTVHRQLFPSVVSMGCAAPLATSLPNGNGKLFEDNDASPRRNATEPSSSSKTTEPSSSSKTPPESTSPYKLSRESTPPSLSHPSEPELLLNTIIDVKPDDPPVDRAPSKSKVAPLSKEHDGFAVAAFDFNPYEPPGWPFPQRAPLTLRKGQQIRVLVDEADTMWAFGELVEHPELQGWFPKTYLSSGQELGWEHTPGEGVNCVVAFHDFDPLEMDWPVGTPQPITFSAGELLQVTIADIDEEWSWGHPVGQPDDEGFIAKAFTVQVSFKTPLERGQHVIVVRNFDSTEIRWPPEQPPLRSLRTGEIMQLTMDEDPEDDWMFGHLYGREDLEGFFPKGNTVPITLARETEATLQSLCSMRRRDLRPVSTQSALASESMHEARSMIQDSSVEGLQFCPSDKSDDLQMSAPDASVPVRSIRDAGRMSPDASAGGMPAQSVGAQESQLGIFRNMVTSSSKNRNRRRAASVLMSHLANQSLEPVLSKWMQSEKSIGAKPVSIGAKPVFDREDDKAGKALLRIPTAPNGQNSRLPTTSNGIAVQPRTPREACSGIGCMVAIRDLNPFDLSLPLQSYHRNRCLAFREGQHVYTMLEEVHGDWSWGYLAAQPKKEGLFPSAFTAPVSEESPTLLAPMTSDAWSSSIQTELVPIATPSYDSDTPNAANMRHLGNATLLPTTLRSNASSRHHSRHGTPTTQPDSEPPIESEAAVPKRPPPSSWGQAAVVSDDEFVVVMHDFDPATVSAPAGHEQTRPLQKGQVMKVLHREIGNNCWCWGHPLGKPQHFCCFPRNCVEALARKTHVKQRSARKHKLRAPNGMENTFLETIESFGKPLSPIQ